MSDEHHHVAAALLVRDGRVLLCHRHPSRRWYPEVWDIPGGHIDIGETPAAALRRELHEELGVMVQEIDDVPWRTLAPAADLTLKVWIVDRWQGEVENRAPDEHDEIGWFRPHEADRLTFVDGYPARPDSRGDCTLICTGTPDLVVPIWSGVWPVGAVLF